MINTNWNLIEQISISNNGDMLTIDDNTRILVIKDAALVERFSKLEKLILETVYKKDDEVVIDHVTDRPVSSVVVVANPEAIDDTEKIRKKNGWKKHPHCIEPDCKTIDRKHFSGGRCGRCYFRHRDRLRAKETQETLVVKPGKKFAYCNYINCRLRGRKFPIDDMIEVDGKYYHSDQCVDRNHLDQPQLAHS